MNSIKINTAAEFHCSPDWNWDTAESNWTDFDLWIITGGKGQMTHHDGRVSKLSRGDCFLLRCYERYLCSHRPDQPLSVICVHFDYLDDHGNACRPDESCLPPLYRHLEPFAFFEELAHKIISSWLTFPDSPDKSELWLLCALMEMENQETAAEIKSEQVTMIHAICDRILAHPELSFHIRDLAGECSYSADHFTRIFKKIKKITPQEFIINAKISAAKALLCNSNHTVGRIAELSGYEDICHFSKQFHQRTGVTPSEFRMPH